MDTAERIRDLDEQVHHIQRVLLDSGALPETIERATEKLRTERSALGAEVEMMAQVAAQAPVTAPFSRLGLLLTGVRLALEETMAEFGTRLGVGGEQARRYAHDRFASLTLARLTELVGALPVEVTVTLSWPAAPGAPQTGTPPSGEWPPDA